MPLSRITWKNLPAASMLGGGELMQQWDTLNAARGDLPFLTGDAIACALQVLGDGSERLLVGCEGTRIRAMFILVPQGKLKWRTFQPSQLPLGAWVSDIDSNLPDLARSLIRGALGGCLVLSITQVDPRVAVRAMDAADSEHTDYIQTGWIDIEGSFDDYWNARGKNLRQNLRKQRAKLAANGVTLKMEIFREHADMAPAIARYGALESSGWKAQQGTAVHPDNAQGRFYRELLERASRLGEALVYQYKFDDLVVAMNLCLVRKGTLVVLKTTYDESIQGFSPAFLLREEELQALHSEKTIQHLEYFGRLMEWHTRWTDNKRTIYHLTLYRWPFLKRLASARRKNAASKAETVPNDVTKETVVNPPKG